MNKIGEQSPIRKKIEELINNQKPPKATKAF